MSNLHETKIPEHLMSEVERVRREIGSLSSKQDELFNTLRTDIEHNIGSTLSSVDNDLLFEYVFNNWLEYDSFQELVDAIYKNRK